MSARVVPIVLVLAIGGLAPTACGHGGGGGGSAAVREAAEWSRSWADDAARGRSRPPVFEIPPPPAVPLPASAEAIGQEVAQAAPTLADLRARVWNETTQTATEVTRSVLCEWFGWYVQDPASRPVPTDADVFTISLAAAMKVRVTAPPEKQLRDASELFRNAIAKGQGLGEDARNFAIAAACSVP